MRPWSTASLCTPSCATPAQLRTWLTPATSAVRMLMLSSQERHEQHLEREQTRAQKMLKMQETLQLSDSEVMDHVQFARQVPCEVHCRVYATVHATVHAMLRSIVRQVRYAHFHWWV